MYLSNEWMGIKGILNPVNKKVMAWIIINEQYSGLGNCDDFSFWYGTARRYRGSGRTEHSTEDQLMDATPDLGSLSITL